MESLTDNTLVIRLRRLRRFVGVVGAVVLLTGLVTGCGDDGPPPQTVAVVIGSHAGAGGLFGADGSPVVAVADALEPIMRGPGTLTVIVNDGRPKPVTRIELVYDGGSSQKIEDSYQANEEATGEALRAAVPRADQADPTAALKLAADAVRDKPNPAVLVFDNGLSTTGPLMMQFGLIDADTDVVGLAHQAKGQLLGSFKAIPVRWHGLCSATGAQPDCRADIHQQLKDYYQTLIGDAEGEVRFDDSPLDGAEPAASGLPKVDVVRWRTGPDQKQAPPDSKKVPFFVVLTEKMVRFQPDSDEYAEKTQAAPVIEDLAARLKAEAYPTAHVTGCTAKDPRSTDAQMVRRAKSRAARVVRDLRARGATTRFSTDGLGWDCPGYRAGDHEANRRVIISSTVLR